MKVLWIANDPTLFEEGSQSFLRMKDYAHAIGTLHVLAPVPPSFFGTKEKSEGSLFLHAVSGPRLFISWKLRSRAHALILKEDIEIVSAEDPFECGKAAMHAVKGTKAKLHLQIYTDFLSPWFVRAGILRSPQVRLPVITNGTRQRQASKVLLRAQGIRVVSKRLQDSLIVKYGTKIVSSTIIPLAIPNTLPPAIQLPNHSFKFALMSIGRLEPKKRIEDILVALARLQKEYSSLGLIIIGDGPERKRLEHWSAVLGLGSNVLFLGERTDAWGLLQNAQAFIQASAYEGSSPALIEAALARVPIITTDVGVVGEVFKGYDSVLVSPPGDPSSLVTHIRGLIEDNEARAQLSMRAEKVARDYLASVHTSPSDIAADLQKVLEK